MAAKPALIGLAGLAAAWFVYTRPIVALALVVGGLCIVGFVTVAAALFWLVFVWGADRSPGELDGADADADADAERYAGGAW